MAQWYYSKGGEQKGPVEQQELQRLLSTGEVKPTDLVWRDGLANWQAASQVPEWCRRIPLRQFETTPARQRIGPRLQVPSLTAANNRRDRCARHRPRTSVILCKTWVIQHRPQVIQAQHQDKAYTPRYLGTSPRIRLVHRLRLLWLLLHQSRGLRRRQLLSRQLLT